MSQQSNDNQYTEQEREENSRVDAMAMLAGVTVLVALVVFFVAS